MKYCIGYTEPAKDDLREAMIWWSDHRSAEQATRWYEGISSAIETLAEQPDRFPLAPESELYPTGLRELHFGLGSKATHRIVFTIKQNKVWVIRVRHVARQSLSEDDFD